MLLPGSAIFTLKPVVRLPERRVTVVVAEGLFTTICPEEVIDHVIASGESLAVNVPSVLKANVVPWLSIKTLPESMAVVKPAGVAAAGLTVRVNACVAVRLLLAAVNVRV